MKRLWILGAEDLEMNAIEKLLRECSETVTYAADGRGGRVHPGNMYKGETLITHDTGNHPDTGGVQSVYLVECEMLSPGVYPPEGEDYCHAELADRVVTRIDHHRPGDPGFGRPPAEFLPASSLGQAISELARLGLLPEPVGDQHGGISSSVQDDGWDRGLPEGSRAWERSELRVGDPGIWPLRGYHGGWAVAEQALDEHGNAIPRHVRVRDVPQDLVVIAAADHCLGHAYAGSCPGVSRDDVLEYRMRVLAARGEGAADELGFTIERLEEPQSTWIDLTPDRQEPIYGPDVPFVPRWSMVLDTRGTHFPQLPDAASYLGIAYLASPEPRPGGDQRRKVVIGGAASPELVRAFIEQWGPAQGLTGIYGDPERGFAGGYLP